ncbi:peptidoglycan-binding protein [Actinosynnema sp. NPDC047251]|uniref:Peptidoglycan binding-like domain-containing protein n=1 Tax=Saccharothrix espanaensis (strain ATCC 51144 / DSM 44229 / JCM 9112 / NBRC 15066 / NRRL 15764) TaxID=1179773 RepID=K0K7U2_SACES|nr:peptidoglycan-binding protein [Saccharothrix espanaensis]CCH32713.1 hypothetical protein BN6_54540 [Saccharothrix espanaensis DSM 44229]
MTSRRRRVLRAVAALLVVAGAGAAVPLWSRWTTTAAPPPAPAPGVTAPVTRATLAETTAVDGELGYGPAVPLTSKAAGTVTWLPEVGAVLTRGDVLLRADEKPVVVLLGPLPMYRSLARDSTGRDVRQFEENLRALGYVGFTVDEKYTEATANAVKRWQRALRVEDTGEIDPGGVVYVPEPVRVSSRAVRIGGSASGEVLSHTPDVKVVTVDARAKDVAWAVVGAGVSVALPGGAQVPGVVAAVGTELSTGTGTGTGQPGGNPTGQSTNATVPVTITVADQNAVASMTKAPVQVRYTARARPDVLTVPVPALLAPVEGGYAVEVVDGDATRVVAVETGLFADGRVEVRGPGLVEGMTVRVPG